jgi:hypothetical protein
VSEYPPVVVEWLDAHEQGADCTPDTIHHEPLLCRTIGFLIRKDRVGVTVATEVHNDPNGLQLRTTNFIPRGMLKRVIRLSPSRD